MTLFGFLLSVADMKNLSVVALGCAAVACGCAATMLARNNPSRAVRVLAIIAVITATAAIVINRFFVQPGSP